MSKLQSFAQITVPVLRGSHLNTGGAIQQEYVLTPEIANAFWERVRRYAG
jgi:hypothetical protein